ncbi:methyltransferase domain-containing protein [Streptomyces sp. NPDC050610]|uniref:methyltransferase domain-containing protein n=1 Tax=Streptomyces sp. NPDC050610 TaxID=3157097 RepID=UPI00342A8A54
MEWQQAARKLAGEATGPGSRWRAAVESVPRHELIPRWWRHDGSGGWMLRDGAADPEAWRAGGYANRSLITRVGRLHADHAGPDDRPTGTPTSSATLPSLVVRMLRHGRLDDDADVLDVGTGSGYSAALLTHRFGDRRVTSVDVDPYLTEAASERLGRLGLHPAIETVDATGPLPGTYDRIVSMVSVPRVPASWLEALKPNGRLVTTITGTSLIIGAHRTPDGGAAGRVERDWAGFMGTRHEPDYPPPLMGRLPQARDQEGDEVTTGRYPVLDVEQAWEVKTYLTLTVPGVESHFETRGRHRTAWLFHEDGSWARAEGHWTDPPTVHQSGPRRLWSELERIRHKLNMEGSVGLYGSRVRIAPDGTCHLARGGWSATIS